MRRSTSSAAFCGVSCACAAVTCRYARRNTSWLPSASVWCIIVRRAIDRRGREPQIQTIGRCSEYDPAIPLMALSGRPVETCVSICRIGRIELIAVSNPLRSSAILELLNKLKIEITGYTEDVSNPDLFQSPQQEITDCLFHRFRSSRLERLSGVPKLRLCDLISDPEDLLLSESGFADFGLKASRLSTGDGAGFIVVGKISAHSDRTHHLPVSQYQDTAGDRRNATS